MKYLLDTHVLLWIVQDDSRLSQTAKSLFLDESHEMAVSLASLWELAIKISSKNLVISSAKRLARSSLDAMLQICM